uniref:JunD proto-onco, AP-1 transcription factor subunit n=1 Tax=Taeniopygia guttata TaxID=59729 RepID=A0A674HNW3_TAEGU
METPFYHDDVLSGLGSGFAPSSGSSGLLLPFPGGSMMKKDALGMALPEQVAAALKAPGAASGEAAGLLGSAELGLLKLASPELERLIIQSNGLVTTTPTSGQRQEFAEGFVKALEDLHKQNQLGGGLPAAGMAPEPPVYANLSTYPAVSYAADPGPFAAPPPRLPPPPPASRARTRSSPPPPALLREQVAQLKQKVLTSGSPAPHRLLLGVPVPGEQHPGSHPVSPGVWGRCWAAAPARSSSRIAELAGEPAVRERGEPGHPARGAPGDPRSVPGRAMPWVASRGPHAPVPCRGWLPGHAVPTGWRFAGGTRPRRAEAAPSGPVGSCAPDVPRPLGEDGRAGTWRRLSVPKSPHPRVPRPIVPASRWPRFLLSPTSPVFCVPVSPLFPGPFVPSPHIPAIPLCALPVSHVSAEMAAGLGSRYRGSHGPCGSGRGDAGPGLGEFWVGSPGARGVPPGARGVRRCGAARYRQGRPRLPRGG